MNVSVLEYLHRYLPELISAGGLVLGFIGGRKSKRVQLREEINKADAGELSNITKQIDIYRGMLDDMRSSLGKLDDRVDKLEDQNRD